MCVSVKPVEKIHPRLGETRSLEEKKRLGLVLEKNERELLLIKGLAKVRRGWGEEGGTEEKSYNVYSGSSEHVVMICVRNV